MSSDYVGQLRQIQGYQNQISHVELLPPRAAHYGEPLQPLHAALQRALAARGVSKLYAHQAAALDAARSGAHIGIVTATASGKTLCYQLPALEAILAEPNSRALLLFPTKALAHDQLRSLHALLDALEQDFAAENAENYSKQASSAPSAVKLFAASLDGDTPRPERERVRTRAQIILSNPDMLHRTVLQDHGRWARLLASLRYVVVDEAHIYRGVFGSHVALVLRRLRRLCAHYGSAPQFICCSATSANPQDHLAALVGDAVQVIDGDGAPQGTRSFVFWNPPVIEGSGARSRGSGRAERTGISGQAEDRNGRSLNPDPPTLAPESGHRRSTNIETSALLAHLMRGSTKTLAFTRTRRGAELVLRYTRDALGGQGNSRRWNGVDSPQPSALSPQPSARGQPALVAAYRAGYTPEQRRELELGFQNGSLLGLVSTNALELGVDIGGVDAVLIAGFPGSVASTWQQAGRAGRSQGSSLAVLVAQDDPLDQFYMRHPDVFFARPHEHARIALDNPYILRDQLRCAAAELPLHDADELWFGPTFKALRDYLVRHGDLVGFVDGTAGSTEGRPAASVNIRSADGDPIALKDAESGRMIEQVAATRAPFEVYPGAVYLHQGDSYLVSELTQRIALARRADVDYYTQTIEETDITIEKLRERRECGPCALHLGVVQVTRRVTGYKRKRHYSGDVLSEHDLSLPPQSFRTVAVWWTVPEALVRQVDAACEDALDGLHAMEHAAIGLLPLFAHCDRADIGGLSTDRHPDTDMATIFVYDGVPGGVGIAQVGYEQAEAWWAQTRALVVECPCAEGCPACIQSPKCGNGNQHLSKIGAAALASLLIGQPVPSNQRDLRAPARADSSPASSQALIHDLRDRLAKAKATPAGPRRAALLVALRYRITTERGGALDLVARGALDQIERDTVGL
ncbi:MAG: DEAD/DEAH box helicase [Roseiflexaceae bacterium]|nr:DEAD/DEAH box helicase [Roseiflexaceae bacterium]